MKRKKIPSKIRILRLLNPEAGVYNSQATISRITKISKAQINRIIKELLFDKLISIYRETNPKWYTLEQTGMILLRQFKDTPLATDPANQKIEESTPLIEEMKFHRIHECVSEIYKSPGVDIHWQETVYWNDSKRIRLQKMFWNDCSVIKNYNQKGNATNITIYVHKVSGSSSSECINKAKAIAEGFCNWLEDRGYSLGRLKSRGKSLYKITPEDPFGHFEIPNILAKMLVEDFGRVSKDDVWIDGSGGGEIEFERGKDADQFLLMPRKIANIEEKINRLENSFEKIAESFDRLMNVFEKISSDKPSEIDRKKDPKPLMEKNLHSDDTMYG